MHESIIANDIINKANAQGNVKSIVVEAGELAHIPADELESALKSRTDWKIKVIARKGNVKCDCGYTGVPIILERGHDSTSFKCPKCNELFPKIISGDKIILKEVEI